MWLGRYRTTPRLSSFKRFTSQLGYSQATETDIDTPINHTDSELVELDDDTGELATRRSEAAKFGDNRIGMVVLPNSIDSALSQLLKKPSKQYLNIDIQRLRHSLISTDTSRSISLTTKEKRNIIRQDPEVKISDEPHYLQYGQRETFAYLAYRFPTTFAAIYAVLNELKKRIPDYNPKSVLDFGCGPGTAMWAAGHFWSSIHRITGIDISTEMLFMAEDFKNLLEYQNLKEFQLKRFISSTNKVEERSDLVIAAFALEELPSDALRRTILQNLWSNTGDTLVIIERGHPAGFNNVMNARKMILEMENKKGTQGVHVVAPMRYKKSKNNIESSKYSYVILRRGIRPSSSSNEDILNDSYHWSRIISTPNKRKGHVITDICSKSGEIERFTTTKTMNRQMYYDARKSHAGDLWPYEKED